MISPAFPFLITGWQPTEGPPPSLGWAQVLRGPIMMLRRPCNAILARVFLAGKMCLLTVCLVDWDQSTRTVSFRSSTTELNQASGISMGEQETSRLLRNYLSVHPKFMIIRSHLVGGTSRLPEGLRLACPLWEEGDA